MGKRANGEGSIFKEKSGRYRIAITVTVAGERKRLTATAWKHAVAVEALTRLRNEAQSTPAGHAIKTVGHLIQRWMDMKCRPNPDTKKERIAAATLEGRERDVKLHIIPHIGSKVLKKFGATSAEDFGETLASAGVKSGAVKAAWVTCRTAFRYGMKYGIVSANPFSIAACPAHVKKKMCPFNEAEVGKILAHVANTRLHALLTLAFYTGMRQAEMFGLRWDRVNMQERYLFVDQQAVEVKGYTIISKPKTACSIRRIELSDIVIDALKSHRAIQMKEGNAGNDLCFPSTTGTPQGRTNWWHDQWKPLLDHLGIHHRGAHNCRHTFASTALANGVDIAIVSKILGHKKISTTYDTYIHFIPAKQPAAVKKIDVMYG